MVVAGCEDARMDARATARWVVQHGLVRQALRRALRRGDLQARAILDPAARADPYPLYDEVRASGPLVRGRLGRLTASHSVATALLRSDDFRAGPDEQALPAPLRRLTAWSRDPRALWPIDPPSLLVVEPPDHTRYRRLVARVFSARAVEALRPQVEAIADGLLDRLEGRSEVDLVESYCTLLPLTVIAEVLGVPPADREAVLRYGNDTTASVDVGLSYRQFRTVDTAVRGFSAWLGAHLERLRAAPGEDLLSQLVHLDDEGQRLDDTELRATAGLLLVAGFETTVNLLGSGTELLLRHPEQRALLRRRPELWPTAVEEVLRFESPVQVTGRFAVRDTELAGVRVPRGRLVVAMLGGANRDPEVFPDPHRFDVTRSNARDHLSFSGGRHFCLGAALARVEGEVGLARLFARWPELALARPGRRRPTRVLRGWEQLPVAPGPARAAAPAR
jgi:cytochrome P450